MYVSTRGSLVAMSNLRFSINLRSSPRPASKNARLPCCILDDGPPGNVIVPLQSDPALLLHALNSIDQFPVRRRNCRGVTSVNVMGGTIDHDLFGDCTARARDELCVQQL